MTTKQQEKALAFILERRGYIVQAFSRDVPLGTILSRLNFYPGSSYRQQPFRVMSETTPADFWEQNQLAQELNDMGMPLLPTNQQEHSEYVKFYRLATD